MLRHLKQLSLAAAIVPLLMLASADAADSQRNGTHHEPAAGSDHDVQYVAVQRRGRNRGHHGRNRYWGSYWNWHNNSYRPYWNRHYRYRNNYGRGYYNNGYTYYYPGYYGRGFNRFNRGSTFGLQLGNFGIRYRDWD